MPFGEVPHRAAQMRTTCTAIVIKRMVGALMAQSMCVSAGCGDDRWRGVLYWAHKALPDACVAPAVRTVRAVRTIQGVRMVGGTNVNVGC